MRYLNQNADVPDNAFISQHSLKKKILLIESLPRRTLWSTNVKTNNKPKHLVETRKVMND